MDELFGSLGIFGNASFATTKGSKRGLWEMALLHLLFMPNLPSSTTQHEKARPGWKKSGTQCGAKAADLAGEGFGGSPLGHRFFPPRFALRVFKERSEKKALRRLSFVLLLDLRGPPQQNVRVALSGRFLARCGDTGGLHLHGIGREPGPRGIFTIEEQPRTVLARRGRVGTVNNPYRLCLESSMGGQFFRGVLAAMGGKLLWAWAQKYLLGL